MEANEGSNAAAGSRSEEGKSLGERYQSTLEVGIKVVFLDKAECL